MNYKIFDYESGKYNEVSKDVFDAHKKWMDNFKAMVQTNKNIKGKIIITSSSPDEGTDDFKKLWDKSSQTKN